MKKLNLTAVALILAALLSSCGSSAETPAATDAETTTTETTAAETELTDGLPDTDMDGFTLSMVNHDDSMYWAYIQLDADELNGDVLSDAIYSRNRSVEDRFNCKVTVTSLADVGSGMINKSVMAGESPYDVYFPRDYDVIGSIEYLLPLNELTYLNLGEAWWNPQASSAYDIGGKLYGASSNLSLSVLSRAAGFAFNKDIYAELGRDRTPYDYVADGEWTIDNFAGMAKDAAKDVNGDGEMTEADRYGVGTSSWKETFARFVAGCGVTLVSQDQDGYPAFELPNDAAGVDKLMKIYELFSGAEMYSNPKINADTEAFGDFTDNGALFNAANAHYIGVQIRDFDLNVGFVPCPKYDESQDRYYALTWATEILTALKSLPADRYENVGMLLEALSFAGNRDVIPIYRETVMKSKYSRDLESEAMFDIVVDSICFDFGWTAWEGQVGNPIILSVYARGGNVASTLESMTSKVETLIEKFSEKLA